MTRLLLSLALGILVFGTSLQAQTELSRFQKQHGTAINKKNLKATQANLLKAMESNNPDMVAGAIQTLRDLELVFPGESFDTMLDPLVKIANNENFEIVPRILALFALENFHSDAADSAIKDLARSTSNKTIKDICSAMFAKELSEE